jgi:hypothetical protein
MSLKKSLEKTGGVMARNSLVALLFLFLFGCSSFAYKFYGIEWAERTEDVKLFVPPGSTASKDISFKACEPTDDEPGKCVVTMRADYFRLLRDYETTKVRLEELERRCGK